MSDWKLFTDGTETYVAKSIEHARALQLDHCGDNPEEPDAWAERTTPDPMTVDLDDGNGGTTKTLAEWIEHTLREFPDGGMLCSTEW